MPGSLVMSSYLITRHYEDADELRAEARGWDLDLVPTGRAVRRSLLFQARAGAVEVGRGQFVVPLIQKGAPPRGHRTFVVPADSTVRFLWRGHRIHGDSILVFPVGGELHCASGRDFHVFTISVEDSCLEAAAEGCRLPSPRRLIGTNEVFACSRSDLSTLRRALEGVSAAVAAATSRGATALEAHHMAQLPALLLTGIAKATGLSPAIPASRLAVVRRAELHVRDRPDIAAPSVRAISALASTSPRTLRRAFLEVYGCGPKEYVLALRYNAARRLLRDGEPGKDDVSALAGRLDFWHRGRFASEYRRRFGESPSDTLRGTRS